MVAPMPLESRDRSIPPGAALVNLNQTLVSQLWAEILVKDVIKEFKLCTLSVSLAQKTEGKQGLIGIRYYKYNHLDHCYWEEGAHTHTTHLTGLRFESYFTTAEQIQSAKNHRIYGQMLVKLDHFPKWGRK